MNKIKEIWEKNKVLIVLLFILLICFIAILLVCITFFFGGSKSPYGDRLDGIDKYPITESFKSEYESSLESDELVIDASFRTKGKVIYVTINFVEDTALVEAESKAAASLEKFDKELLSYYDINFILKCEKSTNSDGFTILGAKNASGSQNIVWNNNTKVESEEE